MTDFKPYQYTQYTSEMLTAVDTGITDLNPFSELDELTPTLPSGKQVIFFSLGIICIVTALGLITRSLIDVPEIAAVAKAIV